MDMAYYEMRKGIGMRRITMNRSVSAQDVMNHPEMSKRFELMRKAGVTTLWVNGYFYGHHNSDPELIAAAKKRVNDEGFEAGILTLPVGHPGNSLNPDDPTLELAIHKDWTYRVDKHGSKVYFCACIDDIMIRHNLEAAKLYKEMGYTAHFFDDDLRMGNWGTEIQGCYCDRCISLFNEKHGLSVTREQLAKATFNPDNRNEIADLWIRFNCDKLTRFMKETQVPGMVSGIMVMHNGGPIHGISIPDIKKAVPDCLFRVGELHFDDKSYTRPGGKESLAASVRNHMALIGDNPAYSETTVFPANALSPENLIDKMKLEISLGLRKLFIMSGSWFMSDVYWETIADHLSELNDLSEQLDAK